MKSGIDPHEPPSGTVPSRPLARLWQTLALTGMVTFSVGLLMTDTSEKIPATKSSRQAWVASEALL